MNLVLLLGTLTILLTAPTVFRFGIWCWYMVSENQLPPSETVNWSEITVRVTTVGDYPQTVQRTVSAISETDAQIQIISEKPLNIEGATVHVVEDEFETDATSKGRALEWARQTLPKRDYILFLDEDSMITSTERLPRGELVQLRQNPSRSGSLLSWFGELQRVGVGKEIYGFDPSDPDYVWGGGLLVSSHIEDKITWDRETLQEDGIFVRKAIDAGYNYYVAHRPQIQNNAPPTLRAIAEQRRRWNSTEAPLSERVKRALTSGVGPVWSLNSIFPFLLVLVIVVGNPVLYALILPAYLANLVWTVFGVRETDSARIYYLLAIFLSPFAAFYNGIGNLYAIIHPAREFEVTEK